MRTTMMETIQEAITMEMFRVTVGEMKVKLFSENIHKAKELGYDIRLKDELPPNHDFFQIRTLMQFIVNGEVKHEQIHSGEESETIYFFDKCNEIVSNLIVQA